MSIHRPCLPRNLQLAPSIPLPARPSSQPPACAFDQPFGPAFKPNLRLSSVAVSVCSAFRSLSSLRLRSIFQSNLPTSLQLSPSIDLPVQPLRQPSACAFDLFSDRTVVPTIGLRFWLTLRLSRCANHPLALLADPPAVLSSQPPTFAGCQPSSFAFQLTFDLRRLPTFRLCLRTQPPTLIDCCALWHRLPANLGLASSTNLPATFRSDLRLSPPIKPSSPAFEPNHRLAARSSVEETLGVLRLCMQVQN